MSDKTKEVVEEEEMVNGVQPEQEEVKEFDKNNLPEIDVEPSDTCESLGIPRWFLEEVDSQLTMFAIEGVEVIAEDGNLGMKVDGSKIQKKIEAFVKENPANMRVALYFTTRFFMDKANDVLKSDYSQVDPKFGGHLGDILKQVHEEYTKNPDAYANSGRVNSGSGGGGFMDFLKSMRG